MRSKSKKKGFVLVTISLSAVALLGACGLAVDLGRMYVAKNELQLLADSAALSAALRLNGEAGGVTRAKNDLETIRTKNAWLLGSALVPAQDIQVDFGQMQPTGEPGNWNPNPGGLASNYSFARVRASVNVPTYFMVALTGKVSGRVGATAIAGQLPSVNPQGLFPFTPMAHNSTGPDFGLVRGQRYTLRWASSPKISKGNLCAGDNEEKWITLSDRRGAQNRGYYGSHAASEIWEQVANDAPVKIYAIGDVIELTGGAKTAVKTALVARINSDEDHTSQNFDDYRDNGHSRRIVTCPITDPASSPPNRVVGYGRFFLLTADNYQDAQGNEPWCAEYLGPAAAEGSDTKPGGSTGMITKVRLWQ